MPPARSKSLGTRRIAPQEKSARRAVVDQRRAVVPKPKKLDGSLTISLDSEAGKSALEAFEHARHRGVASSPNGAGRPSMEIPAHVRPTRGEEPGANASLRIKTKRASVVLDVRVEAQSKEGFAAIPHVRLQFTEHGSTELVLSNEHEGVPLVFRITHRDGEAPQLHSHAAHWGRTADEAMASIEFMLAASGEPATIRVLDSSDGRRLFEQTGNYLAGQASAYRGRLDVLRKLRFVEAATAPFGTFSLCEGLTTFDIDWIEALYRACRKERVERTMEVTFDVQPSDDKQKPGAEMLSAAADDTDIRMVKTGGRLKLLGVELPLGEIEAQILETEHFLEVARGARAKANASGKPIPVSIPNLRVLEEYRDWPFDSGEWEPLARTAEAYGGYFTRSDARAANYNDIGLEALVREGRAEPCSSDVFRLVPYPPSDHEDLILLWLQTDRKAVFSHETALALHDISDVLPRRRHITVPDDWVAPSRRLPIDVVIYRAAVPEVDITWRGDVPVTKPARTVNDCIAAGLPDEIVDQAIKDGVERGMFDAADFIRAPRAESA